MSPVQPVNPFLFKYEPTPQYKSLDVSSFYTFFDEPHCGTVTCDLKNMNGASCDTSSTFAPPDPT